MGNLFQSVIFTVTTFLSGLLPLPTFVEGVVGQPVHLNPLTVSTNQVDWDIVSLIFEGLVKYNQSGEIVGALASSWEISADQRDYTFNLRRNAFWHDGVPFSADDVLFTVSKSPQLREIPVDKLDDYTVRFRLKEPLSPFLDILTLGIVPAHLGDKLNDLKPIGTGPYRLVRLKKNGRIEEIVLQGEGRRLTFRFYESKKDLETAAKLGEIDGYIAAEGVAYTTWPTFNYFKSPLMSRYYALFFNLNSSATLANKQLRQDLARNTPKERIINEALASLGLSIDGPMDGTWAEDPQYEKFAYIPSNEKKYDTKLYLSVPKKDPHLTVAKILKEEWERLGIKLEIKAVDVEKLNDEVIVPRNFQILLMGQEVTRDPDRYTLWHSTQRDPPGLNFTGVKQVRIDKALEEGRRTLDLEKRKEHYSHFQEVFAEEVPAIFLYRPVLVHAVRRGIKGVDLKDLFSPSGRFWNFNQWFF